ncbi:YihY/virulence factor BrkB family protein [Candidatus Villigracilis affinis]|uniref:YihY/virulence factor BrkB family protein n=1 Tax=Candidatus Villigracilis affinis TaxID=3140682 RepID=UPI002A1A0FD9|nr:YihY/virulence factor BrkB family protein [Anaerolineales bacterium]
MTPSKYVNKLWQQAVQIMHTLNERTNGWLWVLANSIKQTLMPNTAIMASAIAYISLFSLFPLILLSISLASFSFGFEMIDQHETIRRLEFIAPALGQLLGQNIDEVIRARGSVTGFALLSLIWSASTIFYALNHTLNDVWNIKQRRSAWKRRGASILFVLVFVGPTLFLISLAGSVIANIRLWLPDLILPFGYGISLLLTLMLDVLLFMILYMILPHGNSTWREVAPGAIGAGLSWEFAKRAFLSFVSTYISITNLVYGTVATIIAFLLWAYISSLIFIFGAYLSVSYWQLRQPPKQT